MGTRGRTPYLIGRDKPLHALFDALDEVNEMAGALVLVGGEAGIGKTRLLDEFGARADHARVVRGGCVEGVAYAPWTAALWWLLGTDDPIPLDELPEGVRDQLARLLPQLGTGTPGDDAEETGQHLLFEAVVELLRYVATRTKLVLLIDDVHWIDPASRELLRYVAANLRRAPALLVVAYRPEDSASERELLAQLGRLGRHRITLQPLPDDASAEMAALLLGENARPADIQRIAENADGNPLYVEELVAALDEDRVPETVRDLMLVRFDSLDASARHLVRTAALIGPRASRGWLTGATGLDSDQARNAARAATDIGVLLVDIDIDGYAFRHALLRQAVLDDIVPDERVALHRSIAESLTDHPERAVGIDYIGELARHWNASADAGPALTWLVAAARQAEERYAFDAAADAYERALFWWDAVATPADFVDVDHVDLLLAAGEAAGTAGVVERAADLGRAALEEACADDPKRGVDVAGRVFPLMWTADRATELFDFAALNLVPSLDHVDPHARAQFLVSNVEHLIGRESLHETREAADRMMTAVAEIDDPALESRAHMVEARYHEVVGEYALADAAYSEAAEIARRGAVHSALALALYNRAAFNQSIPNLQATLSILDEVDELVETYGLKRYAVPARCVRALATCQTGGLEEAARVVTALDQLPAEGYEAWFRAVVRALLERARGRYDDAIAALDAQIVGSPEPTDFEVGIQLAALRADAFAWKGDIEAARNAADMGSATVARYTETYAHSWLALAATRIEADAAALAHSTRQLKAIEVAQARAEAIVAVWHQAVEQELVPHPMVLAYTRGIECEFARLKNEDAREAARQAAEAFSSISMPYEETYFRWREAQAALDADDVGTGTALLKQGRVQARRFGFAGLESAIATLARTHQLRLGAERTTVDGDEPLSLRELEVLRLIVDGKSNPDIAEILSVSRHTARAHVSNILRKLDASSRAEAVSTAHRRGVV